MCGKDWGGATSAGKLCYGKRHRFLRHEWRHAITDDPDDYDVFLETWEPGPRAVHASLPQNLTDPVARMRMLEDMSGDEPLERASWVQGPKPPRPLGCYAAKRVCTG